MSLADAQSLETTQLEKTIVDEGAIGDIEGGGKMNLHAFSYELKSVKAKENPKHKLTDKTSNHQRTSTNTMLLDKMMADGFKTIDSFEPSFNVSNSIVATENAPSDNALILIEKQGV